jgi:hypothetical protein
VHFFEADVFTVEGLAEEVLSGVQAEATAVPPSHSSLSAAAGSISS